jgi:hypothetical protein
LQERSPADRSGDGRWLGPALLLSACLHALLIGAVVTFL